jgi:Poxvirus D5 protein-like
MTEMTDRLVLFLRERFPRGSARVSASELYQEWISWCLRHGMQPGTKTLFGREIKKVAWGKPFTLSFQGVSSYRDGRGVAYRITPMQELDSWALLQARQA